MARILAVDDEPKILMLIERILAKEGHQVLRALNGEEALKKAVEEKPDLVLLDIMMPRMDGWEVLRRMRSIEELREVPVAMLTAKSLTAETSRREEIDELVDYIQKPFTKNGLVEKVEGILEKLKVSAEAFPGVEESIIKEYQRIVKLELLHESMVSTLKENLERITSPYEASVTREAISAERRKIEELVQRRLGIEERLRERRAGGSG